MRLLVLTFVAVVVLVALPHQILSQEPTEENLIDAGDLAEEPGVGEPSEEPWAVGPGLFSEEKLFYGQEDRFFRGVSGTEGSSDTPNGMGGGMASGMSNGMGGGMSSGMGG